jgi:SAM-dependent methyltransferase
VLLRVASPIDRLALILNGKADLPPLRLRRQSGPLYAFERAAAEYVGILSAMTGIERSSRVLDVGCGAGALAIMLKERIGTDGRYLGLDVDRACIRWCRSHLLDDRFDFRHHDYWNATYHPRGGRFRAWPVKAGGEDIVVLKSVFTHMLPADVEFYVAELKRVMSRNGSGLITAFTYESVDGSVRQRFSHDGGGFRFARSGSPESAIAYPREWLLGVFADHGLAAEFHPGFWRPEDGPTLSYQDVIVARHLNAPEERS